MIHFSQLHFSFFLIASEIKHKPALAYAMQFIQSFTPNRMFLSLPLVTWLGGTTQFTPFFIDSGASQSHAAKLTGKTYLGSFHWPGIFLCSFFIMYSQVFLGFRYHSCTHSSLTKHILSCCFISVILCALESPKTNVKFLFSRSLKWRSRQVN